MLYTDYATSDEKEELSFIEEFVALGRKTDPKTNGDFEQIVPSQGNLSDALQDWWNPQEFSFLDSSFMCSETSKMDPKKLPPTYDEHVSAATSSDMHVRTISPCGYETATSTRTISPSGSEVSVLQSESDLSMTDEPPDERSLSLLNDIMECIETVDSQDCNERKSANINTGNILNFVYLKKGMSLGIVKNHFVLNS